MSMTPLQKLLKQKTIPERRIREHTGRSRTTVFRWRRGISYPGPDDAKKLIELFGPDALDYNGCYAPGDAVVS